MQQLSLYFSAIDNARFRIIARSRAGEAESESQLPFYESNNCWRPALLKMLELNQFKSHEFIPAEQDWLKQKKLLNERSDGFSADYLQKIGTELYKSLFPEGEVRHLLQRSLALAECDDNPQLHIRLEFHPTVVQQNALADYPWEMICHDDAFLAHQNVTFSRYIASISTPPSLLTAYPINVLLVSPQAYDTRYGLESLPLDEQTVICNSLKQAERNGHIRLTIFSESVTYRNLEDHLTRYRGDRAPHVLHFDGHGLFGRRCHQCSNIEPNLNHELCQHCQQELPNPEGHLLFEGDPTQQSQVIDGMHNANYVSAEQLGNLLRSVRHGDTPSQQSCIRLVTLSACRSARAFGGSSVYNGVAQNLISHGIPAAVAMQFNVTVDAACAFNRRFYQELGGNRQSLVVAVSQARVSMKNTRYNEWYRPVFYLRWRANDGGQLFTPNLPDDTSRIRENISDFRVLILDDENSWLERHRQGLCNAGFPRSRILGIQHGQSAIDLCRNDHDHRIRFVLIDQILFVPKTFSSEEDEELQMPFKGVEVVREITKFRSDIQFIFITCMPERVAGNDVPEFTRLTSELEAEGRNTIVIHKMSIDRNSDGEYQRLVDFLR